jgi:hypothetical protein
MPRGSCGDSIAAPVFLGSRARACTTPCLASSRAESSSFEKAGSGELEALRTADPELVDEDSAALGAALGRVLDALADGGRALVVGHSPTNEAAVFGLTGQIVSPISKGAGVLLVADDQGFRLETLD